MRRVWICCLLSLIVANRSLRAEEGGDAAGPFKAALRESILESGEPLAEVRAYVTARIPAFEPPKSTAEWEATASSIRSQMLDQIIFRGEAAKWRDADTRVKWFDAIEGGPGYVIRKFRYEALPGMWIPGLLYEPKQLDEKMPVFINVNGHDSLGKATPETQRRCINLARRGVLAYLLEFIYFGQLGDRENRHNGLVQLDLCGTSGVAPFVLALTRGLDVALGHPHADKSRVGVAGLSGGGWQSITLASLDERITLANPVAGHASMFTRAQYTRDVGDSEQIPSDMCEIADYTHLTAMVAPRPLLLTFNAKDDCCFLPEGSLPPLEAAARPVYELYDAADRLRTHINHDPGTHNFERENREKLYSLIRDFFFAKDSEFDARDLPVSESELKDGEELAVPMPAENATLNSLAVQISRALPMNNPSLTDDSAARERLREIIRFEQYDSRPQAAHKDQIGEVVCERRQVRIGDDWTLPVVEFIPSNASGRTLVIADEGRRKMHHEVRRGVEAGNHVLAIDLLAFGETNKDIKPIELQMIATVGKRLLGVQVAQLLACAEALGKGAGNTKLVALGPRTSAIALVAAAVEPSAFSEIELHDSWPSLKEFIHKKLELEDAPEFSCFGLLREFDIPQLEALAGAAAIKRIDRDD